MDVSPKRWMLFTAFIPSVHDTLHRMTEGTAVKKHNRDTIMMRMDTEQRSFWGSSKLMLEKMRRGISETW